MDASTPVSALGLSGRARFALHGGSIQTIGALVELDDNAVLALPAAGQKLLTEIEEALAAHGLALGQPIGEGAAESTPSGWRFQLRVFVPPLYGRSGPWFEERT